MTNADADARRRIEHDLDTSFLVEAAAGTGKTTQLVRRLAAVLEEGHGTVDGLVAVTFTRKAAGELKLRLRQQLDERRAALLARGDAGPEALARLEDALARLEEAHVGTIHGFCAELLRQRPVEAGVDPAFVEIDEDESARLWDATFRAWIERRLDAMPEALRRALDRLAGRRTFDGASPLDQLGEAGRALVDWRDFEAPWRREPWDRIARVDALVERVRAVASDARRCKNDKDYLARALSPAIELANWIHTTEQADETRGRRDHDDLEARLVGLLRELKRNQGWKGRGRFYAEDLPREAMAAARDVLIDELESFRRQADADLAAALRDELREVVADYEARKRASGQVDFLDLLLRARDLLRARADVRAALQARYTHIFVDELQDTDPLQAEILVLLAADDPAESDWRATRPIPGKLFLVGDPKQSIYRFRRADVVLYQAIQDRLVAAGVERLVLSRSFRATAPLQRAINAAFAPEMTGDRVAGQPGYVPLEPVRERHPEAPPQPSLVVVPAPTPYGPQSWSRVTEREVAACVPPALGAWIAWLIEDSGWTIEDPERRVPVPVRPRHVAVLFRRFLSWGEDTSRPYVRELEARGVPHLLVGGRSFHQREEVEAVRAALIAVEWPDDELAVFATLKGALFAVPDDLLLRWRHHVGRLHPFLAPEGPADDPAYRPIVDVLALLRRLHKARNAVPIAETLHRLLAACRAHAGFALRPAGNQVLANIQRVRDLARRFEMGGGLSFRGFVERLSEEAETPGSSTAPVLEEGADGVRLMTVHAAKGLEFPIVVLADVTARLTPFEANRHVDVERGLFAERLLGCAPWELLDHAELEQRRDRAEGIRLAYVAATRARDLLVVPAVGDEPWEGGWTEPLHRAVYPAEHDRRAARPGPGCPDFPGGATVLVRPQRFDGEPETSVHPGAHRPTEGDTEVVWWDPSLLERVRETRFDLAQAELLAETDDDANDAGLRAYRRFQVAHADAVERGAEPSRSVQAVGEADEPESLFLLDVRVERLARDEGRPRGKRFGTLVHHLLREVPLDANADADADGRTDVDAMAALFGRMLRASPREVRAAAAAARAALDHPLLRQASTAATCHRETPFVLDLGERLIEGTLDLAFRGDDGTWVVVDFKTDADAGELEARYRKQVAWYVEAVKRITGEPARGVLLAV